MKQGGNQIFSILDLKQAFHQQPMDPESQYITTCWTPLGLFQWKVNVMGLKNAPQQFQQMVDWVLTPLKDKVSVVAYIDDILVGTRAEDNEDLIEKHFGELKLVLNRLRECVLIVDPEKCHLFARS